MGRSDHPEHAPIGLGTSEEDLHKTLQKKMDNDSIDNLKEFLQMQKMTPSEVVAAQKAAQLAGERQSAQMDAPFGRIEFFDSGSKAGI